VSLLSEFRRIHLGPARPFAQPTVERARALNAGTTVLTFDPSPRKKVLRPETALPLPPRPLSAAQGVGQRVGSKPFGGSPVHAELARLSPRRMSSKFPRDST